MNLRKHGGEVDEIRINICSANTRRAAHGRVINLDAFHLGVNDNVSASQHRCHGVAPLAETKLSGECDKQMPKVWQILRPVDQWW